MQGDAENGSFPATRFAMLLVDLKRPIIAHGERIWADIQLNGSYNRFELDRSEGLFHSRRNSKILIGLT